MHNSLIYIFVVVLMCRNLHRCKRTTGKPPKRKAKPEPQCRKRAKSTWSLHQRRNKRKSSEKDDTSEHLSTVDLTVTSEDELPSDNHLHHEGLQRLLKVSKKQSDSDVSVFKVHGSSLDATCRVLKFDTPPSAVLAETQKPKKDLGDTRTGAKLHTAFTAENRDCPTIYINDDLCEDVDVFRTPTDLGSDLKINRKSRPSRQSGAGKHSFRSMLAALGQSQNKIIKESHSHQ